MIIKTEWFENVDGLNKLNEGELWDVLGMAWVILCAMIGWKIGYCIGWLYYTISNNWPWLLSVVMLVAVGMYAIWGLFHG